MKVACNYLKKNRELKHQIRAHLYCCFDRFVCDVTPGK